ncbi:L-seryl-tRNA(Sec) selenium transferase [Bacillus carboniphilus]|uniref:L-seryl-tRNA(Sec) selenium transferase n=1 Tax=Bacillus carboniphilus TaxID=86663 RepID=A0ABN0VR34_9BACI
MKDWLRFIPSIHDLQQTDEYRALAEKFKVDRNKVHQRLTKLLDKVRADLLQGRWTGPSIQSKEFTDWIWIQLESILSHQFAPQLKRVINATGTVLHTNLGRAPLSEKAIEQIVAVARSYSNLEYNLQEGKRGSRHDLVEKSLLELTGGEAAMIVNNNAAAVYLVLRALAKDQEVIVSRGELVEIGGSFRVSSIMEESGAVLKEVGTTNKTHLSDYEQALNDETAMIMKVHTSNFKMIGFTKSVPAHEIVSFKENYPNVLVYEDLGSGVLFDFKQEGIGEEPTISSVLESGVDLVSFSGDKLLGGPQAGIILGRRDVIARLKKHPLARVLRVDKMTLAGLEGTLLQYTQGTKGIQNIPALRSVRMTKEEVRERSEAFMSALINCNVSLQIECMEDFSLVGGGTMPEVRLQTYVVSVKHPQIRPSTIEQKLRGRNIPIIVRVRDEEILLDLRTVQEREEQEIIEAFKEIIDKSFTHD